MEVSELDNATVLPVSQQRVLNLLDQIGWIYEFEEDVITLLFEPGIVMLSLEGPDQDILTSFIFTTPSTGNSRTDLLRKVNNWNAENLSGPTVVLKKSDDDEGIWLEGEQSTVLDKGITDRFLANQIKRHVQTAITCTREVLNKSFPPEVENLNSD